MSTRTETIRLRSILACLTLVSVWSLCPRPLSARGKEDEAKLVASIERENKPVKKAKMEVRLGRFQLQQAISAYEKQQIPQGQKLLSSSVDDMEKAWSILNASGRNAAKKPQGFRTLEIGLNEDTRRLGDLRRQVFYLNRPPLDDALSKLNRLHEKVLLALFPGAAPPAKRNPDSRIRTSHFSREVQLR